MTINEAKEIMLHLYAYCGFPRCLNGLNTLIRVLEERRAVGTQDKELFKVTGATHIKTYYVPE